MRTFYYFLFLGFCFIPTVLYAQKEQKFALSSQDIEITQNQNKSAFAFDVVTASRVEEAANKAPAYVRVITEEQIRMRNYRSLVDVLRDLSGVKMDEYSTEEWIHDISLNGVRGHDKLIILLDGFRISSCTNDAMPLLENFPVHFAKQIEIVYGAASALYGADALVGVINIISKTSGNKTWSGELMKSIGTQGLHNQQLWLNYQWEKDQSLTIAAQYFNDKQPDMSKFYPELYDMSGHQTGTFNTVFGKTTPKRPVTPNYEAPMRHIALTAKLKIKDFQFGFFHNHASVSSSTSVIPQNTVYNKDVVFAQSSTTAFATHQKNYDKISLISSIQGSLYQIDPKTNFRNQYVGMEAGYKYGFGSMIKADQQISWRPKSNFNVIGGATFEIFTAIPKTADLSFPADLSKDINDNFYLGTTLPMKFFNLKYTNFGSFLQAQYSPLPSVHLTAGLRTDYNSRFGETINPRVGVVIEPSKDFFIKALFGTAFFAPQPRVAFAHYGSFFSEDGGKTYKSFFMQVPNANLKPILSQKFEIQIGKIINKNLSIGLDLFLLNLSGLFVDAPDKDNGNFYNGKFLGWDVGYLQTNINNGVQRNWGASLLIDYDKTVGKIHWKVYTSIDYVNGLVNTPKANDLQIPLVSPFVVKSGLEIMYNKQFSISTRLVAANKQFLASFEDNSNTRQTLDGYVFMNATLRYDWKKIGFFCDIRNVLNQKYYHAAREASKTGGYQFFGIPQMPRRIEFGFQVRF